MRIAGIIEARQRHAIAACLVIALVGAVELVSIYQGSSLATELAYFAIPAGAALAVYRGWRDRMVAWGVLTALSILTVACLVVAFLTL
jgi:hypothetical protein